ncbi:MAG TPA: type II toxin-antitoxin system VapC family toxin [Thermoanaerobaculia bacterium]|nr:type II toxin-antitoxin system VapC family toxin [Thermoanaerobaculia bacterium]
MIVVDTSVLVDSFTGPRKSLPRLTQLIEAGERILLPTLVVYEWLRGPRIPQELRNYEDLFPDDQIIAFGVQEARVAARLYQTVESPRRREIDLAIASVAITHDAAVWTLNHEDFRDIKEVSLI